MKLVMFRGNDVGCSVNHIKNIFGRALGIALEYEVLPITQSMNDLKKRLAPLIFDTTPWWIEDGVSIKNKDLRIVAHSCLFLSVTPSCYPRMSHSASLRIAL